MFFFEREPKQGLRLKSKADSLVGFCNHYAAREIGRENQQTVDSAAVAERVDLIRTII